MNGPVIILIKDNILVIKNWLQIVQKCITTRWKQQDIPNILNVLYIEKTVSKGMKVWLNEYNFFLWCTAIKCFSLKFFLSCKLFMAVKSCLVLIYKPKPTKAWYRHPNSKFQIQNTVFGIPNTYFEPVLLFFYYLFELYKFSCRYKMFKIYSHNLL